MQFFVKMRDGMSFTVDASYIEVVTAPASSYTFLGPVPGYPVAIIATFPTELVAAILPLEQARLNGALPADSGAKRAAENGSGHRDLTGPPSQPPRPRPPLPPIQAADV